MYEHIENGGEFMIKNDSIISRSNEFEAVDLDGEKVIMNLEKGKYFSLNEIGSKIWEMISAEISVNKIITSLVDAYNVDKIECEECVIEYLRNLENIELINAI